MSSAFFSPISSISASPKDCLSCRIIGASAFTGLGVYAYVSGRRQLLSQARAANGILEVHKHRGILGVRGTLLGAPGIRGRMAALTFLSAGLIGAGGWRLIV